MNKHKNKKNGLKLPHVSHTKGYYRFSADFPSVTDSNGYRNNDIIINSPEKKAATKRRIALLSVCTFIISFCVTALCFAVSNVPITTEETSGSEEQNQSFFISGKKSAFIEGDVLSYSSAESIISSLTVSGINTAVIEFKDAFGYFYFKPSITVTAEALSKSSKDAKKIIDEFKTAGIDVFAKISCFADDIYARNHKNEAAFVISEVQSGSGEQTQAIWYGSEYGEKHSWLNPYSNEVLYYLNTIVQDIEDLGVDGIIFENVFFPLSAQTENVMFSLSSEGGTSPDTKTAEWVSYANGILDCKTGVCLSSSQLTGIASKTAEELIFPKDCDFIVPDIRTQTAQKGIIIKTKQYLAPEKTPKEFTAAILSLCSEFLSNNEISAEIIPVIENTDNTDIIINTIAQLNDSKINSYIAE